MDEYKNDNLDNNDNFESEAEIYASNDSNTQKSGSEDTREPACQEENIGSEEARAYSEGQSDSREAEADKKSDTQKDDIEPEVYVWRSGSDGSYRVAPDGMRGQGSTRGAYSAPEGAYATVVRRKRSSERSILAWLIPLVAVAALAMGIMSGFLFGRLIIQNAPVDFVETTIIDMNKNEAPVEVEVVVDNTSQKTLSVAQVAELVADAVVEVSTSSVVRDSFFGNYVVSGAGSGVVIAQSEEYAYIVTNYHVIEGASEVVVTATDGSEYKAEYLDGDASMDIAMLRIKADKEFPKIVCGSSSAMKVGEEVVAIGNPLGQLGGTVTNGIVSALDRRIEVDGTTMVLMQTNAAVNPGNSGGGLFNMAGELIGIVNAKESATGVEGLGFAIPIDRVYGTLVEIIENKYIHGRPTLDIEVDYVSDLWEAIRKYGVNTTGVFVTSSNNEMIHVNDIINSINGELITDEASFAAAISELEVGDTVTVELYRASNDRRWYKETVEVTVKEYVPTGIFG